MQGIIAEYKAEAVLHPAGSKARKLLMWAAIELPDRASRIAELEDDESSRFKECEQLREALCTVKAALEVVAGYARGEAFNLGTQNTTFARDFAPFINIMAHHNDPDYGKPGIPKPHVDTRKITKGNHAKNT